MGKVEYEGNSVILSRMYIEYYKNHYGFHYLDLFDANGNQMIVYGREDINFEGLAQQLLRKNTFYEYVKYPNKEYVKDFWWDINSNYFVFFG